MDDLNRFPKRLLLVSVILIVIFLAVVSVTFFYHPVIPSPCKIAITVREPLPGANNRYKVHVSGIPRLPAGKEYKAKIFIRGEGYFCTLMPDHVSENNKGELPCIISGVPGIKKNDLLNGVAYKDSVSPLPLIRLMFK